jgi:predicted RNA-binding Zn ribbon-like protein
VPKGVKVLFTHDTEVALNAAAALVNTAHDTDELATVEDLDRFVERWGWTGRHTRTGAELQAVRDLRPRLERLWQVDVDAAVEIVNDLLRAGRALPQLVRHDGWNYHIHATSSDAPLADRMAVEAAMAFTDLIRADEFARLQVCAAEDCRDVVVDLSKNRSRRFCSAQCSNRVNVAAFRARRAGRP